MKKAFTLLLIFSLLTSFLFASGAKEEEKPLVLSVSVCSEPNTIDPGLNDAADAATVDIHLFSGLAKWFEEDGALKVVPDMAESLPECVFNDDGTVTYTYTLKDAYWSDGVPVKAADYEYAWKRVVDPSSGSGYGYMFEIVKGYPDDIAVKALDDKTLEVTLNQYVPYWNELMAFPVFFPVREDVCANENWATSPETFVSCGPYVLTGWDHNSVITVKKNENFYDKDLIKADEIKFYISDDSNNMLSNFQNGEWCLIDDVPNNEIPALQAQYPEEFKVTGLLGTYFVDINVNANFLPKDSTLTGNEKEKALSDIRKALSLLIDRNYIAVEIGQAGQVPAPAFVPMGMTDTDGKEFYYNAGGADKGYYGYVNTNEDAIESNYKEAVEILKKYYKWDGEKFTNVPSIEYLYNTSDSHKAIGEYVQSAFASVGIPVNLQNQEWNTFLNTKDNGDYTLARGGWVASFADPIVFLDMWTSYSGNDEVHLGKGEHSDVNIYSLDLTPYGIDYKVENATWSETYDVLISKIKSTVDSATRYSMMHLAEDMLMDTGCVMPIYYYTDIFMMDKDLKGVYSNSLGYKYLMYATFDK